jgi:hypothetical protein
MQQSFVAVILSESEGRVEGSAVVFWEFREPQRLGAPGLDFETWESTNLNESRFVTGHDFSPAEEDVIEDRALARGEFQTREHCVPHPNRAFCGQGGKARIHVGRF